MFEKKGVAFPETLEDMARAAETLTDPKDGTFGFVGRGLRNANMALWGNFFLDYGGEFLDAKGNILTDGPEAIEATKLYQRLLTKPAPPGVAGFNWMESLAAFTQGKAAMWLDGVGWAPPLENPNTSRIVGKVGYSVVPKGPGGQYSATYGDGIGVTQASTKKEAGLSLLPVGRLEDHGRAPAAGRRRRAVPQLDPQRRDRARRREDAPRLARLGDRLRQGQQARAARRRAGGGVPRHPRRGGDGDAVGSGPGRRTQEGDRPVPADPRAQREGVSKAASLSTAGADRPSSAESAGAWRVPSYWPFVIPALVVVVGVIVFPWVFTLWMSVHEWKVGSAPTFTGLANYLRLPSDPRFIEAVWHTIVYTALSIVLPLVFGTLAACIFHARFPLRGLLRGVFILPMMATPVAIALVWTMMFHPQLGVLNYLLSLVGLPPQLWVFAPNTVIPSLVLVETWQWTPLVMLIVLGGLAAIPTEPYESALIDGASVWQIFRHITLPLITPFLFIAAMIRMIDAVKSFDIIYAITQGGPGTASETINLYLYSVAFAYYDIGYGSAIAVVFFVLIVALAAALLVMRRRLQWSEVSGA